LKSKATCKNRIMARFFIMLCVILIFSTNIPTYAARAGNRGSGIAVIDIWYPGQPNQGGTVQYVYGEDFTNPTELFLILSNIIGATAENHTAYAFLADIPHIDGAEMPTFYLLFEGEEIGIMNQPGGLFGTEVNEPDIPAGYIGIRYNSISLEQHWSLGPSVLDIHGIGRAIFEEIRDNPLLQSFAAITFSTEAIIEGESELEDMDLREEDRQGWLGRQAEALFGSLFDWLLGQLWESMDDISGEFGTRFGPDVGRQESYFRQIIPDRILESSYAAFRQIGWTLLILIISCSLLFMNFGGVIGYEERPHLLLGRIVLATTIFFWGNEVLKWLLSWAGLFMSGFVGPERIEGARFSTLMTSNNALAMMLQLIFTFLIFWNLLKLIIELVERYIIVNCMFYMAPMVGGTFASPSTMVVGISFYKMFGGMLFMMVLSIWFLQVISAVAAYGQTYLRTHTSATDALFFYIALLGFIRVAQKIDDHLKDMGLTVARTGGGLASSLVGAAVLAGGMMRLGASAVRLGTKFGKGAAGVSNNMAGSFRDRSSILQTGGARVASNTLTGKLGDRIAAATGKKNMINNGNVTSFARTPGSKPIQDLGNRKGVVAGTEAMKDYLKDNGIKVPAGSTLESSRLDGRGGGDATGFATFRNADGSTSKYNLSTTAHDDTWFEMAQAKGKYNSGVGDDKPLYAQLQKDHKPVGTTNPTKPSSGAGTQQRETKSGIPNPMSGRSEQPTTPMESFSKSKGFLTERDRVNLGMTGDKFKDAKVRDYGAGKGYGVYSKDGDYLGAISHGANAGPEARTNNLGHRIDFHQVHGASSYNASNFTNVSNYHSGAKSENIRLNPTDHRVDVELADGKNMALKDPAYYAMSKNDSLYKDDNGRSWYAEVTEKGEKEATGFRGIFDD